MTKVIDGPVKKVDPAAKTVKVGWLLGLLSTTLEVNDDTRIAVEGRRDPSTGSTKGRGEGLLRGQRWEESREGDRRDPGRKRIHAEQGGPTRNGVAPEVGGIAFGWESKDAIEFGLWRGPGGAITTRPGPRG